MTGRRRARWGFGAGAAIALALSLALATGASSAVPGETRADPSEGGAERVLVVALPAISWAELASADVPTLDAVVERSAVANVSVRGIEAQTSEEDGYATLGSGTRARGSPGGGGAADAHRGDHPLPGIVLTSMDALQERNDALTYGAELGAWGEALAGAGIPRAVLGNADGARRAAGDASGLGYRPAALALVDASGSSPGTVGAQLTVEDPAAPGGRRADVHALAQALAAAWDDGGVVLLDAGDLSRADTGAGDDPATRARARRQALAELDGLVAGVVAEMDPGRDAVVLVGPSHRRGDPHLTVLAVRAPGIEPGLLRSASTRRDGVVMLVDVAPTVLSLVGVDRPDSMEGRAATVGSAAGSAADRWDRLVADDDRAAFRDAQVTPAAVVYVVVQALLWVAVWMALRPTPEPVRARRGRLAAAVEVAALATVAFLPLTYLANLLPVHRIGAPGWWALVVVASLGVASAARRLGRGSTVGPVLGVLALVVAVLAVDALVGTPLQYNAVFGYSPTVGGRFAGLGNLAFAQLAAASILVAALAGRRATRSRAWWSAAVILATVVVVDGSPLWGADVGGVLTLVPAALVTLVVLAGRRVAPRTALAAVVGASVGAAAVLAAFAVVDLGRAEEDRTHLGRLVEDVADEGVGPLVDVVTRKLDANLSVLTRSVWTLMVPVVLVALGLVVWRAPGRLRVLQDRIPELRAALAGLAVAMVLGFALNDSGIAVPGVMLGVVNASLVALVIRPGAGIPVDGPGAVP